MQAHIFAFYSDTLSVSKPAVGSCLIINDSLLYHRIVRVIRLPIEGSCILFNRHYHALTSLVKIEREQLTFTVISCNESVPLQPKIVAALPLLKRDDLESAINGLTQFGVSVIQLLITQKSQPWHGSKELDRLNHIAIAAAEQSKNFLLPEIVPPISLNELITLYNPSCQFIFLHPTGMRAASFFAPKSWVIHKPFVLMVGPEGDVTIEEHRYLVEEGVQCISLTPTVLRASLAIQMGVGLIRSML